MLNKLPGIYLSLVTIFSTFCSTAQFGPPMVGVYSVDQTSPATNTNFRSFTSLADSLNSRGIGGPVTINITPHTGPYFEKFHLNEIQGSSEQNKILINGNGNTIQYYDEYRWCGIIKLNGTDWVKIDSLNIQHIDSLTTFESSGIYLTYGANYNEISRCTFICDTPHMGQHAGISINIDGTNSLLPIPSGSRNYIHNNKITGGDYGFQIFNNTHNFFSDSSNIFIHNDIMGFTSTGIRIVFGYKDSIADNKIHASHTSVSKYRRHDNASQQVTGIRIYAAALRVISNQIYDLTRLQEVSSTTSAEGITFQSTDSTSSSTTIFANNLIYDLKAERVSLMQLNGSWRGKLHSTLVINNSLIYDDTLMYNNNTTYPESTILLVSDYSANNSIISNNLFYSNRPSRGTSHIISLLMVDTTNFTVNNNCYFSTQNFNNGSYLGQYNNFSYTSLQDFQNRTSFDRNSVYFNPLFVDIGNKNFQPTNATIAGIGVDYSSIIPKDIFGKTRTIPFSPGAIAMGAIVSVKESPFSKNQTTVYPNPTNGTLTIDKIVGQEIDMIRILSVDGQKMQEFRPQRTESGDINLDINSYPAGIYFIETRRHHHSTFYKVILKK